MRRFLYYFFSGFVLGALVMAWLTVALFFRPMVFAAETPTDPFEKTVYRDCYADAVRYCKSSFISGRMAIIGCMLQNKGRLRPACSRHLYERNGDALP